MPEGLLTTAQVARRLGVVRWTICRAVAEGRLVAAAKLPGPNGAYLFTEEAVLAFDSRVPLLVA